MCALKYQVLLHILCNAVLTAVSWQVYVRYQLFCTACAAPAWAEAELAAAGQKLVTVVELS